MQSPFTLILSIFMLGTKPEVQDLVCMVLIIFGMTLVVGSKMKEAEEMKKDGLGGHADPLCSVSYEPVGNDDEGKNS